MAKFAFRLERLLDYRKKVEEWAKDAYIDAQAKRVEGETMIERVKDHRGLALASPAADLDQRRALESYLERLDDEQRGLEAAVAVLANEEESARLAWTAAKQEVEALEKLRDKALQDWMLEKNRAEQRDLDEWTSMRRAA